MDEQRLDGNAAGGLLGEVFAVETTAAEAACNRCDNVLIRVAQHHGRYFIDLRGVSYLRFESVP